MVLVHFYEHDHSCLFIFITMDSIITGYLPVFGEDAGQHLGAVCEFPVVLVRASVAVKRHHEYSNSYK